MHTTGFFIHRWRKDHRGEFGLCPCPESSVVKVTHRQERVVATHSRG